MANTIKIKNKTSAGVPIASQMATKELVMHEVDNSLFYKRESDNVVVKVNEGGGGGGVNVTEIEIDFGMVPRMGKTFTITDSLVSVTSKIVVNPSGNPVAGRGSDDWEWDSITFAAKAEAGSFKLYASSPNRIIGKRNIFYTVN
jgi:hypothetical protein